MYPQKMLNHAQTLLCHLFDALPPTYSLTQSLTILVIGSGTFPSFEPLIRSLLQHQPRLEQLNFILVDPNKSATDYFDNYFSSLSEHELIVKIAIHITTYNIDIHKYLTTYHHPIFDIIYLEHPNLDILKFVLAKTNSGNNKLQVSLCESIPYLQHVSHPNTILLASFLSHGELKQMRYLIDFSLNIKLLQTYSSHFFHSGGCYRYGIIASIDQTGLPQKDPKKLAAIIHKDNNYFCSFFLVAILIFSITVITTKLLLVKIFSLFFVVAHLFYHRYGTIGLLIKILLILGQLLLLGGYLGYLLVYS
jgi:hypothetical protein